MLALLTAAFIAFRPAGAAPARFTGLTVEMVAEQASIRPGRTVWAGVLFRLDPGWHVYWRNPGDAGTPVEIRWELPPGWTAGGIQWPAPERIVDEPFANFGYSGRVLLMVPLDPPADWDSSDGLRARARVSWLACKETCVNEKASLALELPAGKGRPGRNAGLFSRTRRRLPAPMPAGWLVGMAAGGESLLLTFSRTGDALRAPAFFYPFTPKQVENAAPQVLRRENGALVLRVSRSPKLAQVPEVLAGILVSGDRAWEMTIPLGPPVGPASGLPGRTGWWWALVLALAGGVILNLMPCVFPVLSIKVVGFARASAEKPREVREHGLLYGLGVVASFWVLAAAMLLFRTGGERLGWGFQLQSPPVVLVLAAVLFLLSLNLLGVFEAGTSVVRAAGQFSWTEGRAGAFFTGVLATFLATPCTGPFMGTALGYAVTRPTPEALGVFTALGIGMAAPYVALSWAPGLARLLPRPGPWMEILRRVMAFPLLASVVWLLWVLGRQAGVNSVTVALGTLLCTGVAGWLYGRWHTARMRAVAALLIAGSVAAGALALRGAGERGAAAATGPWESWSRTRMEKALDSGLPVFVDFTAAWCLTCMVNERVVLDSPGVMDAFRRQKVVLLKADWTNPDPDIERALAAFGRNGVPLYLLYPGRRGARPRILPQVLTPQVVLKALAGLPAPAPSRKAGR